MPFPLVPNVVREDIVERYRNLSGDSAVTAYELMAEGIKVEFRGGAVYLYTNVSAGQPSIEQMKNAAIAGRGLATYISQHVKSRYAARIK